jgi:hypothetical protein
MGGVSVSGQGAIGGKSATSGISRSVWLVSSIRSVLLAGSEAQPEELERPERPDRQEKPALSSEGLWLSGSRGFRLLLDRARFGGGGDMPCIEEDGDQHVAHDELPVATPRDLTGPPDDLTSREGRLSCN